MDVSTLLNSISKGIKKAITEGEALSDDYKDFEKTNNLIEIPIKTVNRFTIDYVFDDLEQIPFEERQHQYELPIGSFARASGYGYKISSLHENNDSIPNKTYNAIEIVSIIKKMFQLADWQIKCYTYNNCNNIQCMLLIGDLYNNKEDIIKVMDAYGWSYAMTDDKTTLQNQKWLGLHFDPIYQNDVNNEINRKY